MQAAQQSIQAAAEAVGLRLKPLDKKAEKALVQAQQDDLKAQLADQTDPAAVLSLVVPLLVMQVEGLVVGVDAVFLLDCRLSQLLKQALHGILVTGHVFVQLVCAMHYACMITQGTDAITLCQI